MEQFCSISLFEFKFDHLILYVNESKSLRRVSGQDTLIAIGFGALNDGDNLAP